VTVSSAVFSKSIDAVVVMVPAYSNQQKMRLKNLPLPQTTRSFCEIPTVTFVMNSFDAVIKAYDRYVPFW
jgi:hypothetical protein